MNYFKQLILPVLLAATMALIYSCQQENVDLPDEKQISQDEGLKQIPLEEALATLEDFLRNNEHDMSTTRSGSARKIAEISTYFGEGIDATETRATQTNNIPKAYLINFADEEGFAVLGANNAVADIVAVTERGQIQKDLKVILPEDQTIAFDAPIEGLEDVSEDDDLYEIPEDSISWYCAEDDDFYSDSSSSAEFISECIKVGVEQPLKYKAVEEEQEEHHSDYAGYTAVYTIKEPLLTTYWGQNSPYNKYCKRQNLIFNWKSAKTGCSTTAMAMIVAHHEYPQTLIVNGDQLNWAKMKANPYGSWLPEESQDDIAKLMASIFYYVKKIAMKKYTLITPKQIEKRMNEFGYRNVVMHRASNLTQSMIQSISDMLRQNKPVFISAIPPKWGKGHSWVIDGAKYSSKHTNRYLLHCNFGWSGRSNGYFSTTCLNPTRAEEYTNDDYTFEEHTPDDKFYTYSWHFRLITYDVPSINSTLNVNF